MKHNSLLVKILYVLIGSLIAASIIISVVNYTLQKKQEMQQWTIEQNALNQQIEIIFNEPVFMYDEELVNKISQAMSKDSRISGLYVEDHRGKYIGGTVNTRTALADTVKLVLTWPQKGEIGTVYAQYSTEHIATRLSQQLALQLVSSIVMIMVLGALLIYFLRKIVITPITELSSVLKGIAEGEGDLTQRVPHRKNDEISELATSFNLFIEQVQMIVKSIATVNQKLEVTGKEVFTTSNDIQTHATKQQNDTQTTHSRLSQITDTTEDIARQAQQTSENTAAMSTISNTSNTQVHDNLSNIKRLVDELATSTTTVTELKEQSQEISRMLDVIRNIAEQTNLLALNASIEAARAGESGRGFSVVADEVRALALKTHQSTAEIETIINQLQSKVDSSFHSTHTSMELAQKTIEGATTVNHSLVQLGKDIEEINMMNQLIAKHSQQQQQLAKESQYSMAEVSQGAITVSENSESLAQNNQQLQHVQQELSSHLSRFTY